MSSQIQVTPQQLAWLSSQISAGAGNIETQLASLQGQVQSVVGDSWNSAASGQFSVLYADWQNSATNLQNALTDIASLLNRAGNAYAENESNITSAMTL